MAIQIPNPGTGNGATGDNEFVLWSKVKDNFSDQTNAASKLVGEATGNVMQVGAFGLGKRGGGGSTTTGTLIEKGDGIYTYAANSEEIPEAARGYQPTCIKVTGSSSNRFSCLWMPLADSTKVIITQHAPSYSAGLWVTELYHNRNTTKDAGTGFLKVSSPVLHVYNDKIDKIHEAEKLDITVDKKGVGHYEIYGTTGLRQDDGWNMSPPRDIHGNVRCMIEVTEKDGVITVKTYKRKFDLELAAIVHDYDNPFDIPEGACVELRFNDLPYENIDDIQTEGTDLDKE